MILTSSYTRVRADSEESFLGWRHFVHELNQFLNKTVTKDTQGLEYATLENSLYWEHLDQPTIEVFTGEKPPLSYNPEKLVSATKYFLEEHCLKIIESHWEPDSWKVQVSGLAQYEMPEGYESIQNSWLKKNLMCGLVIDVRQVGVEIEPGVFKLAHYVPDTQYVDSKEEQFIFSIGKDKNSGEVFAAYDTRFYGDDDYETLYLH